MFPDIGSVLHIRDALWRYKAGGSASVMIGSGFSRNAEPVSPAARRMPNWSDMAVVCAVSSIRMTIFVGRTR
jgi:hypothetical protein